ncbi:radical SAM protein [archaeon]|jgi:sulfatase maturation enzyme AslB (radical SAM superfamily)|nr:radical SAM protein [archaeon]MBT4022078.1 radical SAM protein [archaeon]MBT4272691.1 radical SAM protein [archaeon]MBT4461490.1 radical SAM protein [archaeon]MBT4857741.1 radical SAM protein [archaeon]
MKQKLKKLFKIINPLQKRDNLLVDRIMINVASSCFFKCKTCNIWKNKEECSIDFEKFKEIIDDLKKIGHNKTEVLFVGGEPLINKKLSDMIKYTKQKELDPHIVTNGWLLNKEMVVKLVKSDLSVIGISLDETKEIHDNIRGMPGSYNRVLKGFELVKNISKVYNSSIGSSAIITLSGMNIDNIPCLVKEILKNKNIDCFWIQAISPPFADTRIDPFGKMMYNNSKINWFEHPDLKSLWPSNNLKIEKVYKYLIKLSKQNQKIHNWENNLKLQKQYFLNNENASNNIHCTHYKTLLIMPNGDIMQCTPLNRTMGNIHKTSLLKIWRSKKRLKEKEFIMNCKTNCYAVKNCVTEISED